MTRGAAIVCALVTALSVVDATAQTPPVFQPPAPPPDAFDWVQLTSGEWLKGELIALYDGSLEFDSDELDDLTLDWEDIRQVRTGRVVQVRFRDRDEGVTGRLVVDGDAVRVLGDTEQQFARAALMTITPGEPTESNYWSGNATFGFNLRQGNSDQVEANTVASAKRRTLSTRIALDYFGNYNITDDLTVTNNQRANAGLDWFATARFFVRPVVVEYYRDPFQNFAHRWTVGAAVGYQLVDTARVSWEANIGPAYQHTTFDSVAAGEADTESTAAIWAGTTYTNELTSDIDYSLDYRFLVLEPEAGRYTHHFLTGLSVDAVGPLDLDVSFVWDRVQRPRPEASGLVPKRDDYRLIFGVGFDF
jgi:putative salt-induced outer membrane protein YdiY